MHASSLADRVEYLALEGVCKPWRSTAEEMRESGVPASLIDAQYDNENALDDELFDDAEQRASLNGDPSQTTLDGACDLGSTVHSIIGARSEYLGELYPFHFDDLKRLTLKPGFELDDSPYILLLRISVLKGWACPSHSSILGPITDLFEQFVAASLRNAGLDSAVMGTSEQGGFDDKLRNCARSLGLECNPNAVRHSPNAKDEGVDIVGGVLAHDHRCGEPIWLIQATCGKGHESWESKLTHIDAGKWSHYLSVVSLPYAFLAVPYHLTDAAIDGFMHRDEPRSFLDRLRLVHMAGSSIRFETESAAHELDLRVRGIEARWRDSNL